MAVETFRDLQREVNRLYREKAYQEIEPLLNLEQAGSRFPEREPIILFWRICMNALSGNPTGALGYFAEALKKGYWFVPHMLDDHDLDSLREWPEFMALYERSKVLYEGILAQSKPALLTLPPEPPSAGMPLLIALHGNNSGPEVQGVNWQPATQHGWLLALPRSSQPGLMHDQFVWDDEALAAQEITAHKAALKQQYAFDENCVVLGGFSMGGRVVACMSILNQLPVRGFIAVGPYLSGVLDEIAPHLNAAQARGLRAVLVIGEKDYGCYPDTMKLAEMLREHAIPCLLETYPDMEHVFPPDFAEVLLRALDFITKG